MEYLVTTNILDLAKYNYLPVYMVDGTVPGFQSTDEDRHYDHHRKGGAPIQIDEIPVEALPEGVIVTTTLDADAAVAAAFLRIGPQLQKLPNGNIAVERLRAIAHDCDHLGVSEEHEGYAEFAANAVATLKEEGFKLATEMGLSKDRREWSSEQRLAYYSKAFRQATEWLMAAALMQRPWPGESGEAEDYFVNVQAQVEKYRDKLSFVQDSPHDPVVGYKYKPFTVPVFDMTDVHEYVDPRVLIQLVREDGRETSEVTLTMRTHKSGEGISYTIGNVPLHPMLDELDYNDCIYDRLTGLERAKDPECDPWGGRKTVGGSGWNTSSTLSVQEIVDTVQECLS